jgi:GR25 family glycosyltransferase involved in LPS biosynthesis
MTNEELHNHYFTYGINENRIYNIPNFNIDDYRNYNDDLKHMTDKQLINHYFEYGKYENRITEQDISNNIDHDTNNKDQDITNNKDQDITNNKSHVKNKIELMKNNEKLISNSVKREIMGNIAVYSNYYYTKFLNYTFCPIFDIIKIDTSMNKNHNYLLHNISIFTYITNKKNINIKPSTHVLVINDSKINISFFKYNVLSLEKIVTLFNSTNTFDIIQLSVINTVDNFYKSINNKFTILKASNNEIKHINLDCYLISVNGMNKIIKNKDNKIDLLTNVNIGYITRPYFMNNDDYNQSKNNDNVIELWNKYYRVTSYWDNIFCINLGLDIDKRKNMIKYCNLLNANNKTFFYRGILGSNLPNIHTLKTLKIYDSDANNNLKNGTIGLNVTQLKLINECIEKNYKHVLLLEDDINFNEKIYLNVLDYIFNKYETIDILYLGCSNYEPNINNIMNKIGSCCAKGSDCNYCKINAENSGKKGGKVCDIYNIYEPKKDLLQKICIGGMFAVLMSNKALKIYRDRFTPINNISDVLLCDITFNIKNDYNDKNIMIKTNYDLKTFYIVKNLFNVDITKPSMTDNNLNDIPSLSKIINNKYINYLSKIKQIQFINEHGTINVYISETCTKYYKYILSIILSKFKKVNIGIKNGNNHINIYTIHDNPELFINKNYNNCINICINGENKVCQQNTDIGIITNYNFTNSFNIYFPQIFLSLWERHSYTILNNKKTHFCAYMYSYDVPHRVELFKYISSYKQVDALGKSCNNLYENQKDNNTRDIYNDNETYNDIAVSIYSKYKFVLALENVNSPGYVTEKILNPILAGSIPIYYGSSDAFKIINKKRVIYVNDFKNYEDLLNIIKLVDSYKEFYNRIINEPIFSSSLTLTTTTDPLTTTTTNTTTTDIPIATTNTTTSNTPDTTNTTTPNVPTTNTTTPNVPTTNTTNTTDTTDSPTTDTTDTTDTSDTPNTTNTTDTTDPPTTDTADPPIPDTADPPTTNTTDPPIPDTADTPTTNTTNTTDTDITNISTTNLEYTIFESILSNKLDKAFNIIPKKILIRNNKYDNIYNIKYDLIIKDLKISKNIKEQISDFINKKDIVIINEGREIKDNMDKKGKKGKKDNGNKKENGDKKGKEESINYINKILWINLDKSIDRNTYMNELLKNIPIENIRISAVNGYNDDINSLIDNKNSLIDNKNSLIDDINSLIDNKNSLIDNKNSLIDNKNSLIDNTKSINITETLKTMSMPEIACTMSHIKAINLLNSIEGEYFLICEDDITFTNLNLIPATLEEIIKNAPLFDILLITKIYCNKLDNIYTNWNDEYKRGNGTHDYQICSTAAYIISRNGINKICNEKCKYNIETNKFNFYVNNISVADIFLYTQCNTWVYKYNFISTKDEDSLIHNNHITYHKKSSLYQLQVIKDSFWV